MKSRDKLKILISRNSAGAIGGAELSAAVQAEVLTDLRHQVIFVSGLSGLKVRLPAGIKRIGWLISMSDGPFRQLRQIVLLPVNFIQALSIAWHQSPDVINPHSREDQIAFTLTRWLHHRPVVWKNAGDLRYFIKPGRRGLAGLNQKLLEAAVRRADHIYSLNQDDNDYLLAHVKGLHSAKLSTIPSSILFKHYDKSARMPKPAKTVVGTAIRLHPDKGVQDLIDAFLYIDRADMELWIVGDGVFRSELETLAGHDPRIKFFGHQAELSPFLNSFDIFVQPAHYEPWGRNLIEAMYFGKAIVAAQVGGLASQIDDGQTGLFFQAGDHQALAAQIQKLADDPKLRQQLGGQAAKVAQQRGDFSKIIEHQILPIYETVTGGNRG